MLSDGALRCWGQNTSGQLGLGDLASRGDAADEMGDNLPAVDLGTGRTAVAVTTGRVHTCALLDDHSVKCWGDNQRGQLGLGDTRNRGGAPDEMGDNLPAVDLGSGRTAVAIVGGSLHTCAVLDNGSLKCWGFNAQGTLGIGDARNRGIASADMGDNLPAVDLGSGRMAVAVAGGSLHTCALLDDGSVKCWGWNGYGQLGLGDTTIRGNGTGDMGDTLPAVDLGDGRTATAITLGFSHTCALLDDDTVKCWGNNVVGELGQGNTERRGDEPGEVAGISPIDLGAGRSAKGVAAGSQHTCVLLDNASVKCWGLIDQGLGAIHGDQSDEMGDDLPPVSLGSGATPVAVTSGEQDACALLDDATLRCWGDNQQGMLGLGDTDDRGDQAEDMGDALPAVDLQPVAFLPVPALTVTLSADQTSTRTSEPIDYHVTVHNTGNAMLTGVTITDPHVADCAGPLPDLDLGVRHTIACSYTPTVADVGTFSNTATVDTDQTDPVASNQVDVDVAVRYQPDLTIKRAGSTFVGDGTYNNTGEGQEATAGRSRLGHVDFVVRVGNDGDQPDVLDLRRVGPPDPGLNVRYFNVANGKDLTARIRARTYHTRELAPGESVAIRVAVDITNVASRNVNHPISLRTRSTEDPTRFDTVQATIRVN